MTPVVIGYAIYFTVYAIAWRWGGRTERGCVVALALAQVASLALYRHTGSGHPQMSLAVIDIALALYLLWLGFTSDRFWPMWAAAFQVFEVLMHLAFAVDRRIGALAYVTAMVIGSYPSLAALGIGAWLEGPRRLAGRGAVQFSR